MGPKAAESTDDHHRFRTELVNLIEQRHEPAWLAKLIDWRAFVKGWSLRFVSQHPTGLSQLQIPTQARRVPYPGCHVEGKMAFESPILSGRSTRWRLAKPGPAACS